MLPPNDIAQNCKERAFVPLSTEMDSIRFVETMLPPSGIEQKCKETGKVKT